MSKRTRAWALLFFIAGCGPVFAPDLVGQADRSLPFDRLLADPDLYAGKILILGGTIEHLTLHPHGTLLLVSQRPLDYWDRPQRTARTGGRFLLFLSRPLDPVAYESGREITVAAEVAGTRHASFGDRVFEDPVLTVKDLRLWPKRGAVQTVPTWGDPLYDRYRQPGRPQ